VVLEVFLELLPERSLDLFAPFGLLQPKFFVSHRYVFCWS
jgi:hypothetical protein